MDTSSDYMDTSSIGPDEYAGVNTWTLRHLRSLHEDGSDSAFRLDKVLREREARKREREAADKKKESLDFRVTPDRSSALVAFRAGSDLEEDLRHINLANSVAAERRRMGIVLFSEKLRYKLTGSYDLFMTPLEAAQANIRNLLR